MKVALVCDWLTNVGGAERVLLSLHQLYPDAPIFTSQYNKKGIDWFKNADVRTGWMQILPSSLRRILGPLRQIYFNHLDLSDYDVIISVTGAEAKSIRHGTKPHLCFCHVPTQYYWQMSDEYLKNPGFGILNPLVRFFVKLFLRPLRRADYRAAQRPTQFITISQYAADLIKKYYHRDSIVIHPPVTVENFSISEHQKVAAPVKNPYFIVTSRQVTWKRIDLAVKACLRQRRRLVIIGDGPEHKHLVKLAQNSDLITFIPLFSKQTALIPYLANAQAYLFPSKEPFGIAPVEALAAGCPVIAFGEGGALDYVQDGKNGVLFPRQSVNSLAAALIKFDKLKFDRVAVQKTAQPFSDARFKQEIKNAVSQVI